MSIDTKYQNMNISVNQDMSNAPSLHTLINRNSDAKYNRNDPPNNDSPYRRMPVYPPMAQCLPLLNNHHLLRNLLIT